MWGVSVISCNHYTWLYCLYGTLDPWVIIPKNLEKDTPMWVYGIDLMPRF